jgi:predicted HNH restriction endonuclease
MNCGRPNELELHHLVPVHRGGQTTATNLVVLCEECHKGVESGRIELRFGVDRMVEGGSESRSDGLSALTSERKETE